MGFAALLPYTPFVSYANMYDSFWDSSQNSDPCAIAVWIDVCDGVKRKVLLAGAVILVIVPWIFLRNDVFMRQEISGTESWRLLAPIGISFYTMQIIAYLVDVYRGDIASQKNPAKYALFITFFPQLLQGPIPRYRTQRRLQDMTGVPPQFRDADLSKFGFDSYSHDMGNLRKITENFLRNYRERWEKSGKGLYLWSKTPGMRLVNF